MATRFYLPTTGAAPISPAPTAEWEDTANAASPLKMVTTRINSAFNTFSIAESGGSGDNFRDLLAIQYVSDPIAAQTITGTLKGQMLMSESATAANMLAQLILIVVSGDGSTVRGTLFGGTTSTALQDEITTTIRNQMNPPISISPVTLTSVAAQNGDCIVAEIGARANNISFTNFTFNLRLGDDAASDLPEGQTLDTADNPWIELSANIIFGAAMVEGVGMVPI